MTGLPPADAGLVLQDLCVSVAGRRLLDVSLAVRPGEIAVVTGPSGAGKSSLLAALAGVLDPAFRVTGRAVLGGTDLLALPAHGRRVGLLFQDDLLFPHLSVAGNLAFGLDPRVTGRRARREAVEAALARVGLAGLGPRDPATLSGGERARVSLLRTMLSAPRALLLDEPFSKLHPELRQEIRDQVRSEVRRASIPALLVSHDPQDAQGLDGPRLRLGGQPGPRP